MFTLAGNLIQVKLLMVSIGYTFSRLKLKVHCLVCGFVPFSNKGGVNKVDVVDFFGTISFVYMPEDVAERFYAIEYFIPQNGTTVSHL